MPFVFSRAVLRDPTRVGLATHNQPGLAADPAKINAMFHSKPLPDGKAYRLKPESSAIFDTAIRGM